MFKIVSCQGTKQSTQSEIILPREGHNRILENPKHFCKSWLQEKDSTWSFLLVRNSVFANIWSFGASSFQLAKPERSKLQFRAFAKRVDVPFAGNLLISLKWLFLKTISAVIPKSYSATCIDTALKNMCALLLNLKTVNISGRRHIFKLTPKAFIEQSLL